MPSTNQGSGWPDDVGIIALEIYFPYSYVDQTELESYDGKSAGHYTIGLGQAKMGFCSDREDINSLCLTVVQNLLERNNISYNDIGRLEVGTETIIDKSKSTKTVLMQLFEKSGNSNIEGIDTTNACYGGTAALFNALNWVESSSWDGRYALVVAGDIAVYATGNARPTGGAGAVAMLVGPNAPLVVERGLRGNYMAHVYDFYKPDLLSEFPVVDGPLSNKCYIEALDTCYKLYTEKFDAQKGSGDSPFSLASASAFAFHTPYCKLVQKSFARLLFNDYVRGRVQLDDAVLKQFKDLKLSETYGNRDLEKAFMAAAKSLFKQKTEPTLLVANMVGNMYTSSLYGGLASWISKHSAKELANQRIVLYSYGSGLASSMYSVRVVADATSGGKLANLVNSLCDLQKRLDARAKVEPKVFEATMTLRQDNHHKAPYKPFSSTDGFFPKTWFLDSIDDKHRRSYDRFEGQGQ